MRGRTQTGAKNAKGETAYCGERNETSEGARNRFSRSSMEGWEHRILGDPGTQRWRWAIMAVEVFLGSELTSQGRGKGEEHVLCQVVLAWEFCAVWSLFASLDRGEAWRREYGWRFGAFLLCLSGDPGGV